ncbi:MAG: peptide chain release factor N(5)-glutamine methyltransferase [Lachnospiraceae bacterium]|nr:peptide chain release factor N(5)-glutamine methyltransferase [Lachnospiraceae bacterium]
MTYREAIEYGTDILSGAGIDNPDLDAWYLLQMVCRMERSYYYLHEEDEITAEEQGEYTIAVKKRAEHIPLQYIIGEQEFMGLTFKVNSNVLIPRQDTETLVEEALKLVSSGMQVLDLCTGSGCILISILKNTVGVTGVGSDVSKQALLVAKENAKLHEVDAEWIRSDLYDNIPGRYDLIVSNPPYIPTAVIAGLMPEVRDFEPFDALDGHADGLYFYRRIIAQSPDHLKPEGYLYVEIGYDQGEAVSELMEKSGFTDIAVVKDLAGLDRVVKGRLKPVEEEVIE